MTTKCKDDDLSFEDVFAMFILNGLIQSDVTKSGGDDGRESCESDVWGRPDVYVRKSYKIADAMMAERERRKKAAPEVRVP